MSDSVAAAEPTEGGGVVRTHTQAGPPTTQPTAACMRRLRSELVEAVSVGVCTDIHIVPDEQDLTHVTAMIVGPQGTPYEGGFFHFDVRFPPDYPYAPPAVKLVTTDMGRVRFNPNLYANGKVCLSTLGTWNGPQWTSGQSLRSVLISIQSLMNDAPYHNEPGFEHEQCPGDAARYSRRVRHETLRVAVCGMMENPTWSYLPESEPLSAAMRAVFAAKLPYYRAVIAQEAKHNGCEFEDPFNEMRGHFDFDAIAGRLNTLEVLPEAPAAAAAAACDPAHAYDDDDLCSDPEELDI
eukprot:TRINITY_DN3147_c3_g2_i1.p1 TRINITY_DN3147_c3_g2~~TRINITY_DN3147_c3_g2_i1.p1  ORF type:complete len:295 (+),score=42.02 TRINITY_DN3147_c3_g2_i1:89-973(+)